MKTATFAALTSGAAAQWWGGAPDCAVGPRLCLFQPSTLILPLVHLHANNDTNTPDVAILPVLTVGVQHANVGLAGADILL